jgi:hypothetical protein
MRFLAALLLFCFASAASAFAGGERLDRIEAPPQGWQGPVFVPRLDYPALPADDVFPWQAISFRKEPERYLRAVLDYALEGQDRGHWRLAANPVRRWYHVPWLGPGAGGREFIHGLTRGRDLAPGELGPGQTACRQTWAIALYNDLGGVILGRIWGRGERTPDLSALPFAVGTVAVKLVFTEASATDDPRLAGAPEVEANIHVDAHPDDGACTPSVDADGKATMRSPRRLRLLQFDVAVREERASYKTGWVYGSFVYDGRLPGDDPWTKLKPIGLMWGNDPQLSDEAAAAGGKPKQSIVFEGPFGRGGRMNGVADERSSACSSCHMTAQWPTAAAMTPPAAWPEARCWFRNLDARYTFGFPPDFGRGCSDPAALGKIAPLDFSLQLAIALRNWSDETVKGKAMRAKFGSMRRKGDKLFVNGIESVRLKR